MTIHSAPIQGYTDHIWRNAHSAIFGGIYTYYSPFLRFEKGSFRNKDLKDIKPENNTSNNFCPQIIACTDEKLDILIDKVREYGYKQIDINMGCPFPLITKKKMGSGMIPYPDDVQRLCNTIAANSDISFSIKMRLGMSSNNSWADIIDILNDTPLHHITLHPRCAEQQYKGNVDMDEFVSFMQLCKHRLIYNGDLTDIEQVRNFTEQYPQLYGIMVGRGLLQNPAMFDTELDIRKYEQFHNIIYAENEKELEGGPKQLLTKMKTLWDYFLCDYDHKLIKAIKKSSDLNKYNIAVNALWNSL